MGHRLALVCQRNNNVPFLFESAAAAGHDLVLIHAPGETAPTHLPAAGAALELDVFGAPDDALARLDAAAPTLALEGIVTSRERRRRGQPWRRGAWACPASTRPPRWRPGTRRRCGPDSTPPG